MNKELCFPPSLCPALPDPYSCPCAAVYQPVPSYTSMLPADNTATGLVLQRSCGSSDSTTGGQETARSKERRTCELALPPKLRIPKWQLREIRTDAPDVCPYPVPCGQGCQARWRQQLKQKVSFNTYSSLGCSLSAWGVLMQQTLLFEMSSQHRGWTTGTSLRMRSSLTVHSPEAGWWQAGIPLLHFTFCSCTGTD